MTFDGRFSDRYIKWESYGFFYIFYDHTGADQNMNHFDFLKKKADIMPAARAVVLFLSAALLFSGCSGTGKMYTPDAEEESSFDMTDSASTAAESAQLSAETASGVNKPGHTANRRKTTALLGGTGSELLNAQTIDYYYRFTLDGVSLQLPCSFQELTGAGWEPVLSDEENNTGWEPVVRAYSYEFFDVVSTEDSRQRNSVFGSSRTNGKKIRVCLANFSETPSSLSTCTVCGISAASDSGVSLETSFGAGLNSPLKDLTTAFGTDPSIYEMTKYADGVCSVKYRFSNGLLDTDTIPVLSEAEEKGLAELMLIETGNDSSTIRELSLYYFRQDN